MKLIFENLPKSTCVHKRHGKVAGLLPGRCDGEVDERHVGLPRPDVADQAGPLAVDQAAIPIAHLPGDLELEQFRQFLDLHQKCGK